MHVSYEGGSLEDPWRAPDEEMFATTRSPDRAPDEPVEIVIGFERGRPVAIDGEALSPANLLARLNTVAGTHGVGRVDMVENRFVGLKSRGVYETPGGTVLHAAHRAIESITMDREVMHERDRLAPRFAELIYNGFWFAPEMDFLRAAIDASQVTVAGDVRVRLYKGGLQITGRRSPNSLYSAALANPDALRFHGKGGEVVPIGHRIAVDESRGDLHIGPPLIRPLGFRLPSKPRFRFGAPGGLIQSLVKSS